MGGADCALLLVKCQPHTSVIKYMSNMEITRHEGRRPDASQKLRKFPTKPVVNDSNLFRGNEQGRPLIKFNREQCAIDPTGHKGATVWVSSKRTHLTKNTNQMLTNAVKEVQATNTQFNKKNSLLQIYSS